MLPAGQTPTGGDGNPIAPRSSLANGRLLSATHAKAESPSPIINGSMPASIPTCASSRKSLDRSRSRDSRLPVTPASGLDKNDPKDIILSSFLPRVGVLASADTEELIRLKGLFGGFCGLLKPFGESIPGSVVVRDSVGASKSWSNFGVHFLEFGNETDGALWLPKSHGNELHSRSQTSFEAPFQRSQFPTNAPTSLSTRSALDELVDRSLSIKSKTYTSQSDRDSREDVPPQLEQSMTPAYYALYLEKLLFRNPSIPHETLSHPVACVIAISSQCTSPIETLRDLYRGSSQDVKKVPIWAGNEFLRYYVLVHDEDHDDITKSTALFDQMKRHFGLHCHLLRLRGVECTEDEDDGTELHRSRWLSPEEELFNIQQSAYFSLIEYSQLIDRSSRRGYK